MHILCISYKPTNSCIDLNIPLLIINTNSFIKFIQIILNTINYTKKYQIYIIAMLYWLVLPIIFNYSEKEEEMAITPKLNSDKTFVSFGLLIRLLF